MKRNDIQCAIVASRVGFHLKHCASQLYVLIPWTHHKHYKRTVRWTQTNIHRQGTTPNTITMNLQRSYVRRVDRSTWPPCQSHGHHTTIAGRKKVNRSNPYRLLAWLADQGDDHHVKLLELSMAGHPQQGAGIRPPNLIPPKAEVGASAWGGNHLV